METGTPPPRTGWKDGCCWKFNPFSRTFGNLRFLIPGRGYFSGFKGFVSLLRTRLGLITTKAKVDSFLDVTDRTASSPNLYAEALSPSGTVSRDRALKELIQFKRGHKDGALIQQELVSLEETPDPFLPSLPSHGEKTMRGEWLSGCQEEGSPDADPASASILDVQPPAETSIMGALRSVWCRGDSSPC